MAQGDPTVRHDYKGETRTSTLRRLNTVPGIVIPLVKTNHIFLVPLIVLSFPSAALFQQQIPVLVSLVVVGFSGMLMRNQTMSSLTSASLLGIIVWGKIATDLYGLPGLDSALLLSEFMLVILLMEFSNTAIFFDQKYSQLRGKNDDISAKYRAGLTIWAREQFYGLSRLVAAAFGLSLSLVVVGDLIGVSVNQIAFSGALVLLAVVALVVLLTYKREPEDPRRPQP